MINYTMDSKRVIHISNSEGLPTCGVVDDLTALGTCFTVPNSKICPKCFTESTATFKVFGEFVEEDDYDGL